MPIDARANQHERVVHRRAARCESAFGGFRSSVDHRADSRERHALEATALGSEAEVEASFAGQLAIAPRCDSSTDSACTAFTRHGSRLGVHPSLVHGLSRRQGDARAPRRHLRRGVPLGPSDAPGRHSPCPTARRSRRSSSTTITSAVRPTSKPSSTADPDAFDARARAALAAPTPADPRLAAPAPDDADDERTRGSLAPSRDDRTARVPSHPRPVILLSPASPSTTSPPSPSSARSCPWRTVPGTSPCSVDRPDRSPRRRVLSRFGTRAFASPRRCRRRASSAPTRGRVVSRARRTPVRGRPRSVLQTGAGSKSVDGERIPRGRRGHFGGLDGGVVRRAGARGGFPSSHRANPQPTRGRDDRSSGVRGGGVGSRVARFLDSLALLRRTRLADVTPLRRRVATLINLYNLGVATSRATIGAPRSSSERSRYFDDVRWVLGDGVYTLNDVEHGLWSNRPHPYRLFPQFARRRSSRGTTARPPPRWTVACTSPSTAAREELPARGRLYR